MTTSTPGFSVITPPIPQFAGPGRILLVDDEIEMWWEDCIVQLSRCGYRTDTAEDGEEAWEALQKRNYDLLITDNRMPKVSGLELITNLRAQGAIFPIVFASSALPPIGAAQKHYFADVQLLEKPVTPSRLLATIRSLARPRCTVIGDRLQGASDSFTGSLRCCGIDL